MTSGGDALACVISSSLTVHRRTEGQGTDNHHSSGGNGQGGLARPPQCVSISRQQLSIQFLELSPAELCKPTRFLLLRASTALCVT